MLATASFTGLAASPEQIEFFETRVRPVLANHCYECRWDRIESPFGGFRLDGREAAIKGSDSGPALVHGKPGQSRVMAILGGEPVLMPCTGT